MSGLRHRDLEQLDAAVVETLDHYDGGIGLLDEPIRSAVEAIVARAVNAALTEAADAIGAMRDSLYVNYGIDLAARSAYADAARIVQSRTT